MIGFVADPKRVDYWTSYMDYGPLEELKKTKHWERLSEKDRATLEWGAANAKVVRERLKKRKEEWALKHSQVKEKVPA